MKNPFKRNPKQDFKPFIVPMSTVLRNVIYDAGFDHPEKIISSLGLTGVSDEVGDMERAASVDRLNSLDPVAHFVHTVTSLLARATVENALMAQDEQDAPEEQKNMLAAQLQRQMLAAALISLAELNSVGLIHIAGVALGTAPMERAE